jgi:hypothetical protein
MHAAVTVARSETAVITNTRERRRGGGWGRREGKGEYKIQKINLRD